MLHEQKRNFKKNVKRFGRGAEKISLGINVFPLKTRVREIIFQKAIENEIVQIQRREIVLSG